jgi:hypothetical protein
VFLAALLDAARLGLEPGTEQYYLTPRKVKGRLEILGIVGYQGYIELMYRAGAVSSVVAEVVYSNDKFTVPAGPDERPVHEIDWDADDRGDRCGWSTRTPDEGRRHVACDRGEPLAATTSSGSRSRRRGPTASTRRGRRTPRRCG